MKQIILLISFILLSSCNNEDQDSKDNIPGTIIFNTSLTLSDTFDQSVNTFTQGETINVEISLSSNARENQILKFNTYQFYDLYIVDDEENEMWRQSDITNYKQEATELILEDNHIITFIENLDKNIFEGGGLDIGSYTLYGYWLGYGSPTSVEFEIE